LCRLYLTTCNPTTVRAVIMEHRREVLSCQWNGSDQTESGLDRTGPDRTATVSPCDRYRVVGMATVGMATNDEIGTTGADGQAQ